MIQYSETMRLLSEAAATTGCSAFAEHDGEGLHLDRHLPIHDRRRIGLDRHHTGRRDHLAGADIELAVVEIALDHVVLDIAFRQRAGAVGARIVGDVELAADIEYRERQILDLDLERGTGRHLVGAAELDTLSAGHGRWPRCDGPFNAALYSRRRA